jgi:biopolymer transport protein ExbD
VSLSRRVVALRVAALLALPAPMLLVALAASPELARDVFRHGGIYAWFAALAYALTLAALAVLGGYFLKGSKVSGSVLYASALAPFLVGIAGAVVRHREAVVVLGLAGGAADARRVMTEGLLAAEGTVVMGTTMTAVAMLVVALTSVFRIVSLGTHDRARPMAVTTAVMVAALAVATVARARLHTLGFPLSLVVLVGSLGVAVVVARHAHVPITAEHEEAVVRFRALSLLALAVASSVLFAGLAGYAVAKTRALESLAESNDEVLLASLTRASAEMHAARWLGVLDALLLFAAFLVPAALSGGWRRGLRPRATDALALVMIVLGSVAGAAQARLVRRDAPLVRRPDPASGLVDVDLPVTERTWEEPQPKQMSIVVTRDGTRLFDASRGQSPALPASDETVERALSSATFARLENVSLLADRRTTYRALKAAVRPANRISWFSLFLARAPEGRPDLPELGELVPLLVSRSTTVAVSFQEKSTFAVYAMVLGPVVLLQGSSARVWGPEVDAVVPMGRDEASARARHEVFVRALAPSEDGYNGSLTIAPRDEDTLDTILQIAEEASAVATRPVTIHLRDDRRTPDESGRP